ncbi:hypothetical protein TNCV_233601 [Trichonephila clavipes]|nr:hypothetical protein TNCV_233601 [Trichonephila clavipes]
MARVLDFSNPVLMKQTYLMSDYLLTNHMTQKLTEAMQTREPNQGTGLFLDLNCDRASKTAISRLASGHTKSPPLRAGRLF